MLRNVKYNENDYFFKLYVTFGMMIRCKKYINSNFQ